MGLLKLLTFPFSLPVSSGTWVLRTVLSEAERRYYDEAAIMEEMSQLERHLAAGELDQEMFDQQEEALLQRLLDARQYWRDKQSEQPEE